MLAVGDLGALFLRTSDGLRPLEEHVLSAEHELQALIARHPELIPLEQIDSEVSGPPLLLAREASVGGLDADHLFIDSRATPLIVECKPAYSREQRREVVAQMLDYAAAAHLHWDSSTLARMLVSEHGGDEPASARLAELEHDFADESAFWQAAEANIRAGNFRLLFVADRISEQLQVIVEFLNERMTPTEVLAMEVLQYRTADGQEMLQARLVGHTEEAVRVKRHGRRPEVLQVLLSEPEPVLRDEADLWLIPSMLPRAVRPPAAEDPRLKASLDLEDGSPMLRYCPPGCDEPVREVPSKMWNHIRRTLEPSHTGMRARGVARRYSLEPGGPSLKEIAEQRGLWA